MAHKHMPQESFNLLHRLAEHGWGNYIITGIISIFAGMVRLLIASNNGETLSWRYCIAELVISAFVGLLVMVILQYFKVDVLLSAAIVAVISHMGGKAMPILRGLVLKNLNTVTEK